MGYSLDVNSDPHFINKEIARLHELLHERERLAKIRAARTIDLLEDVHAEFIPVGEPDHRLENEPRIEIWTDNGSVSLLLYQFENMVSFVRLQQAAHIDEDIKARQSAWK